MSEWTYVKPPHRIDFLGEVKHRLVSAGEREVEVVVKPDSSLGFELATPTALALDGSKSMLRTYAAHLPKIIRKKQNKVHTVAQQLSAFLATNSGNQCAVAYWACGDDGGDIEPVGVMNTQEIAAHEFAGAQHWGGGTKLTPIVRYFWEQIFAGADKKGLAVFLTDGAWDDDDHSSLLQLSNSMCDAVASEQRHLMKCVVLGLRTEDNKGESERIDHRFNALNNYEHASGIDIWYTAWVEDLEDWTELFIELVKGWPLGVAGFVEVQGHKVLQKDEFNFGIQFKMPSSANAFTLHLEGVGDYSQNIV